MELKHNPYVKQVYNRGHLESELNKIGSDEPGIQIMKQKSEMLYIKLSNVELRAANIIKQEMLSKGGDAAVHKGVSKLEADFSDVFIMGTRRQISNVIKNFAIQPFGLKEVGQELKAVLAAYDLREKAAKPAWADKLDLALYERTLIMGIMNFTPDSFSDGGAYNVMDLALARVEDMLDAGVDIIDIGGESTRAGADPVSADEEMDRVLPLIRAIRDNYDVPLSIDTYKASVAEAALDTGADIINDVWGGRREPEILRLAADREVPIILMHNRDNMDYGDLMQDIVADVRASVEAARAAGVQDEMIILDPGIGFAKTYEHNLEVMYNLRDLTNLGYPLLLGTSNKSLIAKTLNLPVGERLEGTLATLGLGIERGADIVRVHDVRAGKRFALMMDAMLKVKSKTMNIK